MASRRKKRFSSLSRNSNSNKIQIENDPLSPHPEIYNQFDNDLYRKNLQKSGKKQGYRRASFAGHGNVNRTPSSRQYNTETVDQEHQRRRKEKLNKFFGEPPTEHFDSQDIHIPLSDSELMNRDLRRKSARLTKFFGSRPTELMMRDQNIFRDANEQDLDVFRKADQIRKLSKWFGEVPDEMLVKNTHRSPNDYILSDDSDSESRMLKLPLEQPSFERSSSFFKTKTSEFPRYHRSQQKLRKFFGELPPPNELKRLNFELLDKIDSLEMELTEHKASLNATIQYLKDKFELEALSALDAQEQALLSRLELAYEEIRDLKDVIYSLLQTIIENNKNRNDEGHSKSFLNTSSMEDMLSALQESNDEKVLNKAKRTSSVNSLSSFGSNVEGLLHKHRKRNLMKETRNTRLPRYDNTNSYLQNRLKVQYPRHSEVDELFSSGLDNYLIGRHKKTAQSGSSGSPKVSNYLLNPLFEESQRIQRSTSLPAVGDVGEFRRHLSEETGRLLNELDYRIKYHREK